MIQPSLNDRFKSYFIRFKQYVETPNAGRAYRRRFNDTDIEVYPGIYSSSPQYVDFLISLHDEMSSRFKITEAVNGVFQSAPIASDFSKLKTKAGSVRPLSFPMFKSKTDKFMAEDHRAMMRKVINIRYANMDITKPGYLANKSSSGFPLFSHEVEYKKVHLKYLLSESNAIDKLLANKDLEGLSRYGILFANNIQIRRQADKWVNNMPKMRKFSSFIEAHHGIEKDYPVDSLLYSMDQRLGTCRTRVVRAFSGPLNYLFTAAVAPFRNWADSTYQFTYKHQDQESILNKFKRFSVYKGLDVTQFDNSITGEMLDLWAETFPFKYPEIVKLIFRSPTLDSTSELANGDPLDISSFKYTSGLPSGVFCTSMMGKDIMSAVILTALQRVLARSLTDDEIKTTLLGENPDFGFLNMGDDSVIMGRDETFIDAVYSAIKNIFFKIDEEYGITFLGNLLYKSEDGLALANNMESYLEKAYIPERSITSALRPYPMLGLRERRKIYSNHPLFADVRSIERDLFYQIFGKDQLLLEEDNLRLPVANDLVLTDADLDVLTSFDKIFYKYDASQINPAIRSIYVSSIDSEDTKTAINLLIKKGDQDE